MDKSLFINTLTGKRIPKVRLLLAVKNKMTKMTWFYTLLLFFKTLGLLVISISFLPTTEDTSGYRVTNILRSITSFGILGKSLTYATYSFACYFSFLILIGFIYFYSYTQKQIRVKEDYVVTPRARLLTTILSIIFHLVLILSQHLIELFSFVYIIQFNAGTEVKNNTTTSYLTQDYSIFSQTSASVDGYFLMFINTIGIILLNYFIYFAFAVLNEPFFDSDFPIKFKSSKFSNLMLLFLTNIQCIHYVELFISSTDAVLLFKYIVFGIILLMIAIGYYKSYNSFNFYNANNYLINFILCFSFISILIEIFLYLTDKNVENIQELLFIQICKINIAVSVLFISYILNEKLLIAALKKALFQPYYGYINTLDLNSLFYFMSILVKFNSENLVDMNKVYNIILNHRVECSEEACKCQKISKFQTENIFHEINLILESIFVNLNLGRNSIINILFSEYLYFQRKSTLFSWSIMNTFVQKNIGSVDELEIYHFFLVILKKVDQFDDDLKLTENYVHFNLVFKEVALNKFYEKKTFKFMENFENFVNFKEKLDASLKVDHFENRIDSHILESSLPEVVEACRKFQELYKKIKDYVRKDFSVSRCKSIELSYRIYAFFLIFNKKAPRDILSCIFLDSSLDVYSGKSIQKYFNHVMKKYFSDTKSALNMIVEVNKMFKIKYINHKICKALGFPYSKLINDDLHQLFPSQLREPHKKVLLNHFLIQKKVFFKKKTFAFTASNNMVPLELMVSTFPSMKKNLQAVVSIYPSERDNSRNFFFVITEFFELIAISDNLDTIYSLNYEMIDKLQINILKLFDIDGMINVKFKTQLEAIQKERNERHLDHLYSLSSFLFNLNKGEDVVGQGIEQPPQTVKKEKNSENSDLSNATRAKTDGNLYGSRIKNNKTSGTLLGGTTIGGTMIGKIKFDPLKNISDKLFSNLNGPEGNQYNSLGMETNLPNQHQIRNSAYTNYQSDPGLYNRNDEPYSRNEENKNNLNAQEGRRLSISDKKKETQDEFDVLRDKSIVIENLNKIRNRVKDMENGVQFYEQLTMAVETLRESSGKSDNNIFSKPFSRTNKQKQSNVSYSENFQIKVSLRKINDAPFYIIGVKEKTLFKNKNDKNEKNNNQGVKKKIKKDLTVIGEDPEEEFSPFKKNKKKTVKFGVKFAETPTSDNPNSLKNKFKFLKKKTINNLKKDNSKVALLITKKEEEEKKKQENLKKEQKILSNPDGILSIPKKILKIKSSEEQKLLNETANKEEKKRQQEKKKETIITIILGVLLIFNLVFAAVVFDFKLFVLNTTKSFFFVNYWSKAQEASLLSLHSALISYMLSLNELTTFNNNFLKNYEITVPISDLRFIIEKRSNKHRDNFAKLFYYTKASPFEMTDLQNLLYSKELDYKTVLLTWEPVILKQTLIQAIDYICSYSRSLSFEEQDSLALTSLSYDINSAFLFEQFNIMKFVKLSSKHSKLLYYINMNILQFYDINSQIDSARIIAETNFNNSWRQLTNIIEIVNIGLSFILITVIHYALIRFDKNLFMIILSMFLNLKKGKKASFKATFECQLIKTRLKQYKTLTNSFLVENIKNLDESLNIDEYGITKLLMRNHLRMNINDLTSAETTGVGETTVKPHSFLQGILGIGEGDLSSSGIAPGLNSSSAGLLSANSNNSLSLLKQKTEGVNKSFFKQKTESSKKSFFKQKTINAKALVKEGQPNLSNINEVTGEDEKKVGENNQPKQGGDINNIKNLDFSNSKKKTKKNEIEEDPTTINIITNSDILKRTKHYSIRFIKVAKILITLIFLLYIFFIITNLVLNSIYLKEIDGNIQLVSSFLMKFPAVTRLYNMIRLMISQSDFSYVMKYNDYMALYAKSTADTIVFNDKYQSKLPNTYSFYQIANSQDYTRRIESVCTEAIQKTICQYILKKDNGYNKEGIPIAVNTVLQTLNNIYKDYYKIHDTGNPNLIKGLSTKEALARYFKTDEFANLNLEMEYVFDSIFTNYFINLDDDMNSLFDSLINLDLLLGVASICLNFIIILYLIFGFFKRLRISMSYISYSASKFNRALYEI